MKMLCFTFRDSLQEEVYELLKRQDISAYTVIAPALGRGRTGAAFGALTTHGENAIVLAALPDDKASQVAEAFRARRAELSEQQHGAAIPMRLLVLPCEAII